MNNPTFFGLLAEFGAAEIPLEKVAPKYLLSRRRVDLLPSSLTTPNPHET